MKKLAVIIGLVIAGSLVAYGALASDWLQLADVPNTDVTFYIDKSTVKSNVEMDFHPKVNSVRGKRVKHVPADGSLYDITTLYIDCTSNEFAVGDELIYKGSTIVHRADGLIKHFGPIPKNSAITQVQKYLCH